MKCYIYVDECDKNECNENAFVVTISKSANDAWYLDSRGMRTILFEAKLPKRFWVHTCHLWNDFDRQNANNHNW